MTRFIYDQFTKDCLNEVLTPIGKVETSRNLASEVREIDVLFTPSPTPTADKQALGLLGRLANTPAIFEAFRNLVTVGQIRSCMSKLFDVHVDIERQAKRQGTRLNEADLPMLWILSPTASPALLDGFKAIPDAENWPNGVYFLADYLKTAIVVIHQLPRTQDTLWLRILGKGTVQQQAILELVALPENYPHRANTLELLYNLRVTLEANANLEPEDRELIMELSPLYLQRLDAATQQGRQEGRQEGQQEVIENLLRVRFGTLDDQLGAIATALLKLPPEEYTLLLLQLSRDELLARFRNDREIT